VKIAIKFSPQPSYIFLLTNQSVFVANLNFDKTQRLGYLGDKLFVKAN
jgi:hypothetical protein